MKTARVELCNNVTLHYTINDYLMYCLTCTYRPQHTPSATESLNTSSASAGKVDDMAEKHSKTRKPNYGTEEIRFMLLEITERNVLFGSLSSKITSHDKKKQWMEIAKALEQHGWVRRDWEDIRKKWQDLQALTKEKNRKRNKTGEGAVNWTPVNDLVVTILGSDNPKLVAIPGGLDTSQIEKGTTDRVHSQTPCSETRRPSAAVNGPTEWTIPIKKR